jgi:hypothetical protein
VVHGSPTLDTAEALTTASSPDHPWLHLRVLFAIDPDGSLSIVEPYFRCSRSIYLLFQIYHLEVVEICNGCQPIVVKCTVTRLTAGHLVSIDLLANSCVLDASKYIRWLSL